jgi:hypothetical protein
MTNWIKWLRRGTTVDLFRQWWIFGFHNTINPQNKYFRLSERFNANVELLSMCQISALNKLVVLCRHFGAPYCHHLQGELITLWLLSILTVYPSLTWREVLTIRYQ